MSWLRQSGLGNFGWAAQGEFNARAMENGPCSYAVRTFSDKSHKHSKALSDSTQNYYIQEYCGRNSLADAQKMSVEEMRMRDALVLKNEQAEYERLHNKLPHFGRRSRKTAKTKKSVRKTSKTKKTKKTKKSVRKTSRRVSRGRGKK